MKTPVQPSQSSSRGWNAAALVGAILVLALLMRLSLISRTAVLSKDSYFYIRGAEAFAARGFLSFGLSRQPPLLIMLMAALMRLGLQAEAAGLVISVTANLTLIPLIYLLGMRLFEPRAGVFAAALFAVHPMMTRASVEVLRDNLFFCLFLWAVFCVFRALDQGKIRFWCAAGLGCGLALCTRREGWELPMAVIVLAAVRCVRGDRAAVERYLRGLAVFVIGLVLAFAPMTVVASRYGAAWRPWKGPVSYFARHWCRGRWRDADVVKERQL